jgi:hypothetical protein
MKNVLADFVNLKNFLYDFSITFSRDVEGYNYQVDFKIRQEPILRFAFAPIQSEEENGRIIENGFPPEKFYIAIARALQQENGKENLEEIISHHTDFTDGVINQDKLVIQSFSSFTQALIQVISDQPDKLMKYFADMSRLCANIVKLDKDPYLEKIYLDRIITFEKSHDGQFELFLGITNFPFDFYHENPVHKKERLVTFISEYWVNLYDFQRAATTIKASNIESLFLKIISFVYQKYYLLGIIFILSLFTLVDNWMNLLPAVRIGALIAVSFVIIVLIYGLLNKDNIRIMRLSLPRMAAAITAGFAIFITNPEPWSWGSSLNFGRVVLLTALTYTGSIIYLFFEVDTTQKFMANKKKKDVWKSTLILFLIGLSQALTVGAVIYALLLPAMGNPGINRVEIINIQNKFQASLSVSTLLLLAWSGLALFLGSFIELVRDNGRVTDAV